MHPNSNLTYSSMLYFLHHNCIPLSCKSTLTFPCTNLLSVAFLFTISCVVTSPTPLVCVKTFTVASTWPTQCQCILTLIFTSSSMLYFLHRNCIPLLCRSTLTFSHTNVVSVAFHFTVSPYQPHPLRVCLDFHGSINLTTTVSMQSHSNFYPF
jgi:hypothetical protein